MEDKLVVELKAFSHMTTNEEVAQCLRYMQVTGAKLGLLLYFGRPSLERHRITPPLSWGEYNPKHDRWLRTEGYKPLNSEAATKPNPFIRFHNPLASSQRQRLPRRQPNPFIRFHNPLAKPNLRISEEAATKPNPFIRFHNPLAVLRGEPNHD